jgi:hypothetical protein
VSMAMTITHDRFSSSQPLLSPTATCHTGPKEHNKTK